MPVTFDDTTIEQLRKLHKFLLELDNFDISKLADESFHQKKNQFMFALSQAISVLEAIK